MIIRIRVAPRILINLLMKGGVMMRPIIKEILSNLRDGQSAVIFPDYGLYIPCNDNGEFLEDSLALHNMLKNVKFRSIIYFATKLNGHLNMTVGKVVAH